MDDNMETIFAHLEKIDAVLSYQDAVFYTLKKINFKSII